jgi:2-oxoglutarate ferredoxin oxidoreductase subunit delta
MPAKGWIEVSDAYCKGCELCISACPQDVIELDMSRLTPKGYHPAHTFKDGCTGCAICALFVQMRRSRSIVKDEGCSLLRIKG